MCKHLIAQNSQISVVGNDPVAWSREKCNEGIVCSGPERLKHADLHVAVLRAAIQILQAFITWIKEPSQIAHHTIDHFGLVKYAELVDPMEENGNSK